MIVRSIRSPGPARGLVACALALAFALPALAQSLPSPSPVVRRTPPRLTATGPGGPAEGLSPEGYTRLRQGAILRDTGRLDSARVVLERLLDDLPHHPVVLRELARVHELAQRWPDLERLAVRERLATRDSSLLAEPLALALERAGRPAAAAQIALEAWAADPGMGDWAQGTLARLGGPAAKPVREALRRALAARPDRADLARALARLAWSSGDAREALRTAATAAPQARPPLRWWFAEDLARGGGSARDTAGAVDALLDLAADRAVEMNYRVPAAQRAWELASARGSTRADAPRIASALTDLPATGWDSAFLVGVARALREGGRTGEARRLLAPLDASATSPGVSLERALADLRDGPPARALPAMREAAAKSLEGAWRYAEALLFAAQGDSAKAWYQRVSEDAASPWAGAAFERLFLVEDAGSPVVLAGFARLAYAEWRGDPREAAGVADSLFQSLSRGAMWAQAAVKLAALREGLGDAQGALAPLLAVADSLPGDRLAPLARQRLGDLYLERLHDEAQALAQYEECLARYPRAWNAAEVRRRVETLRRERRF